MKIRFIGDVHGKFNAYKSIIADAPASIQVGDMGVGFKTIRNGEIVYSRNPPFDAMKKGYHRFIRGNHDNPEACKQQSFWIEDGATCCGVFCLGGAVSIDRHLRTEGLDWWRDEELSIGELNTLIDIYAALKPDYVCTHDCPDGVANAILGKINRAKIEDGSRTRQALQAMFEIHQPKYWVFGHWHLSTTGMIKGTKFQCLNELEYEDVEIGG